MSGWTTSGSDLDSILGKYLSSMIVIPHFSVIHDADISAMCAFSLHDESIFSLIISGSFSNRFGMTESRLSPCWLRACVSGDRGYPSFPIFRCAELYRGINIDIAPWKEGLPCPPLLSRMTHPDRRRSWYKSEFGTSSRTFDPESTATSIGWYPQSSAGYAVDDPFTCDALHLPNRHGS